MESTCNFTLHRQDALLPLPFKWICVQHTIEGIITPHIVRKINHVPITDSTYTTPKYTSIDEKYFNPIIKGMERVYTSKYGTAKSARIKNISLCGKTGTAENPHGDDHSIFIAFAPIDEPKIALAVYVENGGWGSTWAAPIASLVIEKYLTGEIQNNTRESFILNGNLTDIKNEK